LFIAFYVVFWKISQLLLKVPKINRKLFIGWKIINAFLNSTVSLGFPGKFQRSAGLALLGSHLDLIGTWYTGDEENVSRKLV
jgi:hypothetical protein